MEAVDWHQCQQHIQNWVKIVRLFSPQFLEVLTATSLGRQISGLDWPLPKFESRTCTTSPMAGGRMPNGNQYPEGVYRGWKAMPCYSVRSLGEAMGGCHGSAPEAA